VAEAELAVEEVKYRKRHFRHAGRILALPRVTLGGGRCVPGTTCGFVAGQ